MRYMNLNYSCLPNVYYTPQISSHSLLEIFDCLDVDLYGSTAVKISSGEPGGNYYLKPSLIKPLVNKVKGTLVECCTAYKGRRFLSTDHWKVFQDHGFTKVAKCDILDEFGELCLPIQNSYHLCKNLIGKNLQRYNSMIVLSHFKGHSMAGFGGALKNLSIGLASSKGKAYIHTAGITTDCKKTFEIKTSQEYFLESMVDACSSVVNYMGSKNIVYINIADNLSIDCDCSSNPEPKMKDIGIFASTDPVALDKACYDFVANSNDKGKYDLIQRIKKLKGLHILTSASQHNLGSLNYNLLEVGAV